MRLVIFFWFIVLLTATLAQERIRDYSWEGFLAQGKEHYQAQRYENAFYYFEKAIRWLQSAEDLKKKEAAELFFLAGESLRHQKREFEAVPYYERSLYLNREQSPIYLFLGAHYSARRQYTLAIYHYGEYFKRNPEDRRAVFAYALALADNGQQKEALAVLQKLPVKPTRECLYEDPTKQQECLEENLLANLASPQPYLALLRFHESRQNVKQQIEIAEALRRLMGDTPKYIYPAVFSYYRANRVAKAVELLEKMVEDGIAEAKTYRLLVEMSIEMGNKEKVEKYRSLLQQYQWSAEQR